MKMSLALIFMMSIMLTQVSHPIALVVVILSQTTICCLFLLSFNTTSWFSFILFLIFLGGLMVLFIYIASLASNEKFTTEYQTWLILLMAASLFLVMYGLTQNNQPLNNFYYHEAEGLMNMYTTNVAPITSLAMTYLLLTLVVVVKMTSKYEGPIRNMIYKN